MDIYTTSDGGSIFDLNTDLTSKNEGVTKLQYQQIPPTRDISGRNFAGGKIHFKIRTGSGLTRWIPSKSYIRTRLAITKGDGTPIDFAFNVAPNMGIMNNLIQNASFSINNTVVSRVSEYIAQCDSVKHRLTKSDSWLRTIGYSTNWWQASQKLRQSEISNDGEIVRNEVPVDPAETVSTRVQMGFDATGADNNSVAYTAATGRLVFAQGTSAGGQADFDDNFEIGDIFVYTAIPAGGNGVLNVRMEVIDVVNATTLTVRANGAVDVAASGLVDFVRIRPGVPVASPSLRANQIETIFVPPLSIFDIEKALPHMDGELIINPQTEASYMKRAIESALGEASKNHQPFNANVPDANNIKVEIVDMYFYMATVDGPRVDDITYFLDLEQIRCQSSKIDTSSFSQKTVDVSPSSFAITTAYQDLRVGENTGLSPSKFKSYEDSATPSNPQELKLNRYFINFSGVNYPPFGNTSEFSAGRNYITQTYLNTQINSGAYLDTGGAESINDYIEKGMLIHHLTPRDETDMSTRVTVNQQFEAGTDVANMRLLVFDHSRQVARVKVEEGRITAVDLADA